MQKWFVMSLKGTKMINELAQERIKNTLRTENPQLKLLMLGVELQML